MCTPGISNDIVVLVVESTFIQIGPNLPLYQIFSAEKPKTTLHCPIKAKVCSELTNEPLFTKINFVVFSFSAEKI